MAITTFDSAKSGSSVPTSAKDVFGQFGLYSTHTDLDSQSAALQKQFDDTLKSTASETAALQAQGAVLGMTSSGTAAAAGAAAAYQKQMELINAAVADGLPLTKARLAGIVQEASDYGDATAALQKQQEAEQRVITQMDDMRNAASGVFSTITGDIENGTNALKTMEDAAKSLLNALITGLQNQAVTALLGKSGTTGGGLLGTIFGGLFGGSAGGGIMDSFGSLTAGGMFHAGGIVGETAVPGRYVDPAYFDDAPRFHGGLMPDEFAAILRKGEGVFTPEQMRALGAGGGDAGSVSITNVIHVGSGSGADTKAIAAAVMKATRAALAEHDKTKLPGLVRTIVGKAERGTKV